MLFDKLEEVVICPVDTTFGIYLMAFAEAFSGFEFAFSGQINVSGFQSALVDETIDRAHADGQIVATNYSGMVNRLAFEDQRCYLVVNRTNLLWRQVVTCP